MTVFTVRRINQAKSQTSGLELPTLSKEQLSPAPAIKLGQLVSFYNDDGAEQKFNSGRLQPTPHSPLSEELILQKPPTGPLREADVSKKCSFFEHCSKGL